MTSLDPTSPLRRLPPITAAARAAERLAAARDLAARLERIAAPATVAARPEVRPPCRADTGALLRVAARDLPPLVAVRMTVPIEAPPRAGEGRRERMPDEVADVVLVVPVVLERGGGFGTEVRVVVHGFGALVAPRRMTVREILGAVARCSRIPIVDLLSARRTRRVARVRQLAMWLATRITPASLPQIGRAFGGRDHTTVLHARRATEARIGVDAELTELAAAVLAVLGVEIGG